MMTANVIVTPADAVVILDALWGHACFLLLLLFLRGRGVRCPAAVVPFSLVDTDSGQRDLAGRVVAPTIGVISTAVGISCCFLLAVNASASSCEESVGE